MGALLSVPVVFSGVLVERDVGGEVASADGACDLTAGLAAASGRGIAMDSAHGVFHLAALFALR